MKSNSLLVGLPTYNESNNLPDLIERILSLKNIRVDILIVDDNSPDGTGKIADDLAKQNTNIEVIHRQKKSGIGSAHLEIIQYAYKHNYEMLITMDSDFSHAPEDLETFLDSSANYDIVVGTRFDSKKSLEDWTIFRKFLTHFGHFLTRALLKLPFDSTGGLRLYKLKNIPRSYFNFITHADYEFFFVSLSILYRLGCNIVEVPIVLKKRVHGNSKMNVVHVVKGVFHLLKLSATLGNIVKNTLKSNNFVPEKAKDEWDEYWGKKREKASYDIIASFYRYRLIKPNLNKFIKKYFSKDSQLLHAGCGSGETDVDLVNYTNITALDLSDKAISRYKNIHGKKCKTMVGSIFDIPVADSSFDGIYNLGVMEHFLENEIVEILQEFNRVLLPKGKVVLFWPPSYGVSVFALRALHFVLNGVLRKGIKLHPDEPTQIKSRSQIKRLLDQSGFVLEKFSFGFRDAFTYVVVVASKKDAYGI